MKRQMKRNVLKLLSIMFITILVISSVSGIDLYAYALNNGDIIKTTTLFTVPNYEFPNDEITANIENSFTIKSIGGVASEMDQNELYVLKGGCSLYDNKGDEITDNDTENQLAVLCYYPDITKGNKGVSKFLFRYKLLGHANAIAIDKTFVYITTWPSENPNYGKSQIVRISRKSIREFNAYLIKEGKKSVQIKNTNATSPNGTALFGYMDIYYNNDKTKKYDKQIKAITGYQYKNNGKISKFIIDYDDLENGIKKYTFAEISNDSTKKLYVKTDANSVFGVEEPLKGKQHPKVVIDNKEYVLNDVHVQDIGYSKTRGLYIPFYYNHEKDSQTNRTISGHENHIVRISKNSFKENVANRDSVQVQSVYKLENSSYSQYEAESISFTNANIKGKGEKERMLISVNRNSGGDSIEYSDNFF